MLRARWLLLVSVASMGCAATTPLQADMLIYCDRSPGALADAVLWKSLAESEGPGATLVTAPGEFEAQLSAQAWGRVIISARYAPGEPSYAAALRAFATAHPQSMVYLFMWCDNGTQPAPDTAVVATAAHFLWNQGMTTKSYSSAASQSTASEAHQAQTVSGLVFPDFSGIAARDPRVLLQVPAAQAQGLSQEELIDAVEIALSADCPWCGEHWKETVASCNAAQAEGLGDCETMYGPDGLDPNPDKYGKCVADANEVHTNCVVGAGKTYNRCVDYCKLLGGPPPEVPQGPGDPGEPGAPE